MKPDEIRTKSKQEILDEISACKRGLLNIHFQWQAGETHNTSQSKNIRKDIARLKTILREIDLNINKHLYSKG